MSEPRSTDYLESSRAYFTSALMNQIDEIGDLIRNAWPDATDEQRVTLLRRLTREHEGLATVLYLVKQECAIGGDPDDPTARVD